MISNDAATVIAVIAFAAGAVIGTVNALYKPNTPLNYRETVVKKNDLGRELWHKSQERWT